MYCIMCLNNIAPLFVDSIFMVKLRLLKENDEGILVKPVPYISMGTLKRKVLFEI